MSTANEREDDIERLLHEGRVFRWTRSRTAWPGHATFVALRGGLVVLGDRYASEGIERTYSIDRASLLEGTFQDVVAAQVGAKVLDEILAEVRRELGEAAPARPASPPAKSVPTEPRAASSPIALPPSSVLQPVATTPAPAPQPPPAPATTAPAPVTQPLPKRTVDPSTRVDVAVVSCARIGLPLVVALRGITRSPAKEILSRLQALPCRVASGLSREQAEAVAARIAGLGAEIQILPAGA